MLPRNDNGRSGSVTLIHIGDLHGHLVPRPDALGDARRRVGGLAQLATVVGRIRAANPDRTLLVNVGDAVQGSAEALFTSGQAVVDALAPLGIDAYVPGNWDYVYGIDHFVESFAGFNGRRPTVPWPSIASNLYYATPDAGMRSPYVDVTGERVLPPFLVRDVGGVRVAQIGDALGFPHHTLGPLSLPLTIFATVGVINAINLIDGVDGLAGTLVLCALAMFCCAASCA